MNKNVFLIVSFNLLPLPPKLFKIREITPNQL